MKFLSTMALTAILSANLASADRNPVGEYAYYKLDRNSNRTSGMFTKGEFHTKVTHELTNEEGGKDFQVKLDYSLTVTLMGNQTGTELIDVPAEYFTEEFLQELRVNGTYETPDFKVKHQGFADAVNMDGKRYPGCDKVLFYDIKTTLADSLRALLKRGAQAEFLRRGLPAPTAGEIENLRLLTHVSFGQPVLGAVKLDVTGKYNGMNLKAGADYLPK